MGALLPSFSSHEKTLLIASPLFRGLDETKLETALGALDARVVSYAKEQILHQPNTVLTHFGLVLKGAVHACMNDLDGHRMILADVVPGVSFGESLAFLKTTDSPVYIVASEPSKVLWLSPSNLFDAMYHPFLAELQKRFTALLATRTLAMNNRIQVLSKVKLRDKLVTYFSQMAMAAGASTFQLPMNREDLAVYMGTNRCALSRELSAMKKEGLIDFYRSSFRILPH